MSTRVGYAGGTTPAPTYRSIGDHTETIEIDFDPEVVTYRELLEQFWASHNPCARPWSRQYMSAVFVHDEAQQRAAEETAATVGAKHGKDVTTEIVPLDRFYLAEAYHQKYSLRRLRRVNEEFEAMYPDLDAFVRSTAVTRANAVASGGMGQDDFDTIADELGLSEDALTELARNVR